MELQFESDLIKMREWGKKFDLFSHQQVCACVCVCVCVNLVDLDVFLVDKKIGNKDRCILYSHICIHVYTYIYTHSIF